MKRIFSMALALMLCLCLFAVPVHAAGAGARLTGPGTVRAGDTITLTFTLSGSGLYGVSGTLSYNASQLELVQTRQQIGSGWIVEFSGSNFVAYDNNLASPVNGEAALFTVTFKVKSSVATGTPISVAYTGVTASDGNADSNIGYVSYSAVIAAPRSDNNDLKSLTVSNATITPSFSANVTAYSAEVPFEVSKLNISAQASDSNAKVSIYSPELIPGGTTSATITVTAENGNTKTYVITVKRAQDPNYVASSNCDLADICVDDFLLSPMFTTGNTQYVVWVPYETENISVSGVAAHGKATVRVEGGNNLVAGADNVVKVICIAEDGTQKVYTVVVKRAAAHSGTALPTEPPASDPTEEPTEEPIGTDETPAAQTPVIQGHSGCVDWWMLLIVALLCLALGVTVGMLINKKHS